MADNSSGELKEKENKKVEAKEHKEPTSPLGWLRDIVSIALKSTFSVNKEVATKVSLLTKDNRVRFFSTVTLITFILMLYSWTLLAMTTYEGVSMAYATTISFVISFIVRTIEKTSKETNTIVKRPGGGYFKSIMTKDEPDEEQEEEFEDVFDKSIYTPKNTLTEEVEEEPIEEEPIEQLEPIEEEPVNQEEPKLEPITLLPLEEIEEEEVDIELPKAKRDTLEELDLTQLAFLEDVGDPLPLLPLEEEPKVNTPPLPPLPIPKVNSDELEVEDRVQMAKDLGIINEEQSETILKEIPPEPVELEIPKPTQNKPKAIAPKRRSRFEDI